MADDALTRLGALDNSCTCTSGRAQPLALAGPVSVMPRATAHTRIVIVEDEPLLARNVARYLEREGHSVTVAATHAAGLACCLRQAPDVVIVDQILPDGTGVDLIRRLRGAGLRAAVVMVTAQSSAALVAGATQAGVDVALTKPVSLDYLGQVVCVLAQRGRRTGREQTSSP